MNQGPDHEQDAEQDRNQQGPRPQGLLYPEHCTVHSGLDRTDIAGPLVLDHDAPQGCCAACRVMPSWSRLSPRFPDSSTLWRDRSLPVGISNMTLRLLSQPVRGFRLPLVPSFQQVHRSPG